MKFDRSLLQKAKSVQGMHKVSYVAPPPPTPPQPGPGQDPMMAGGAMPPGGMPPGPPAGPPGPAMAAQPSPPGQPPLPGDATGGAMPPDMQQLVQMVVDALSQGADPNQLMDMLMQQGYPPEVGQQAIEQALQMLQGQAGPPSGAGAPPEGPPGGPMPEPINLRDMMDRKIKDDMAQKKMDPESRITMLESKIDSLTEIIQDMVNGLPPKEASDKSFLQSQLQALEFGDYYEI